MSKKKNQSKNSASKSPSDASLQILKLIFALLMGLVAVQLIRITVADSGALRANGYNPRLEETEARFIRGSLLDSRGNALAFTQTEDGKEKRIYPYGEACAHVTGYIGLGKTGMEKAANSWLLQPAGLGETLKQWVSQEKILGCDAVLTLDAELQQYIYEQLKGYKGAVVVSEPTTGKILALVSSPSYDPETLVQNWDQIREDPDSPLYARATQGLYPPGSTFKIVTALSLYRTAEDPFEYQYICKGSLQLGDTVLDCVHRKAHGTVNVRQAFARSCNGFFAGLGVRLGEAQFRKTSSSLHLEEPFAFELPQSTCSVLPEGEISEALLGESAIGQGQTLMTPFQMNMLTAAIANQGTLYNPYLLDRVQDKNGKTVKKFLPEWYGQLMTVEEAAYLEELMGEVTASGTAQALSDERWQVWGKTGTAQVGDGDDHSWFTGYAKKGSGRSIAVTVLIENGGTKMQAVPLTRKILEYYMK